MQNDRFGDDKKKKKNDRFGILFCEWWLVGRFMDLSVNLIVCEGDEFDAIRFITKISV